VKRDLPPYVYRFGRKGYLYFRRTKSATPVRIVSEFGTPEFWAEYARHVNGAPVAPKGYSFKALIHSYRTSDRFTTKAQRTRQDYDKILTYLHDKWGDHDPRRLKRKDVIFARDANKDAVRFANYVVQVLSILMEHAIDIGWRDDNPAKGVALLKSKAAPRGPWPDDLIAAYRETAEGRALLIFELLVGTGQRIGDVLQMQWGDVQGDDIRLRQSKTGAALLIPLTDRLKSLLAETPRTGLYIVAGEHGRPVSYRAAADAVMRVRKAIGAEAHDIHALRHTAAHELAAAGCTDAEIMSITGHTSEASVRRYSAAAAQARRARDAQRKRT
jgi:integrase